MDKLDMESKNILSENVNKIFEMFPETISEEFGRKVINFDISSIC